MQESNWIGYFADMPGLIIIIITYYFYCFLALENWEVGCWELAP